MSDAAVAWLEAEEPDSPAPLRTAMDAALAASAGEDVALPDRLAGAALRELTRALELGDVRAAAYPLLTADALLTAAMAAAAEQGLEAVRAAADAWGAVALAPLLEVER